MQRSLGWLARFRVHFDQIISSRSKGSYNSATRWNLSRSDSKRGTVTLIGAGPGDAELLTLKAYRALQSADVILFDALVSKEVVDLFSSNAEQVYVGKRYGQHSMSQTEIIECMLGYANRGLSVVRVKGGDPAIFARIGEECAVLEQHHIPFAVVPGITAASGASAYAGIPLTHRAYAQSVRFITAHLKSEADEPDWASMVCSDSAKHGETLVFYMGLRRISTISDRLIAHGMRTDMPVAVIEHATHPEQRTCFSTLRHIASDMSGSGISGPAIVIVGEVVNYRYRSEQLSTCDSADLHQKEASF